MAVDPKRLFNSREGINTAASNGLVSSMEGEKGTGDGIGREVVVPLKRTATATINEMDELMAALKNLKSKQRNGSVEKRGISLRAVESYVEANRKEVKPVEKANCKNSRECFEEKELAGNAVYDCIKLKVMMLNERVTAQKSIISCLKLRQLMTEASNEKQYMYWASRLDDLDKVVRDQHKEISSIKWHLREWELQRASGEVQNREPEEKEKNGNIVREAQTQPSDGQSHDTAGKEKRMATPFGFAKSQILRNEKGTATSRSASFPVAKTTFQTEVPKEVNKVTLHIAAGKFSMQSNDHIERPMSVFEKWKQRERDSELNTSTSSRLSLVSGKVKKMTTDHASSKLKEKMWHGVVEEMMKRSHRGRTAKDELEEQQREFWRKGSKISRTNDIYLSWKKGCDSDSDGKAEPKRSKWIRKEFVHTEEIYVDKLQLLLEVFLPPILRS